jgi:hypothetical protein
MQWGNLRGLQGRGVLSLFLKKMQQGFADKKFIKHRRDVFAS